MEHIGTSMGYRWDRLGYTSDTLGTYWDSHRMPLGYTSNTLGHTWNILGHTVTSTEHTVIPMVHNWVVLLTSCRDQLLAITMLSWPSVEMLQMRKVYATGVRGLIV